LKEKLNTQDMTQGTPWKLIVLFAIPLLLGNALQQFYNMADTIIVGNYGGATAEESANAMAGVGVSFPIFFMISSLFMGLGIGATVMISQFKGAGQLADVRRTANTMYSLVIVAAIPLGLVGMLISEPLLQLINVSSEIMPHARAYLMVIMGGLIFTFGYNANAGILQGLGDGKTSLLFLGISAVVNVALDLVFVICFNLGALGVGIATIMAQATSWIFGVFYINKKYPQYKIDIFRIRFEKDILVRAVKLGLPAGIQQMLFSVGVLTMSALINTYSESFVAGFTAANKIDAFAFMPITSFSNAATTFVGQNIGAGRMDRVKVGVRSAVLMSVAVSIVIAAVLYPLGGFFMSLFNQSPDVIASGCEYLYRILPFYWMLSITFILNGSLRGAGSSVVPMLSAIISLWLARVPAAYLLSALGQNEIFWCFAIGWVPGIIISGGYFLSGKWKNKSIISRSELPEVQ